MVMFSLLLCTELHNFVHMEEITLLQSISINVFIVVSGIRVTKNRKRFKKKEI